MALFGIATLTPVVILAIAAIWGGGWTFGALIYLTCLTYLLDSLVRWTPAPRPETEFPAAHWLSLALAIAHFGLLVICVTALVGSALGWGEKAALFVAAGMFFGQISNANAHELIHRSDKLSRGLGMWVYISLLFGHHTSAHLLVHHRCVATEQDPNTARLGESYYAYAARAWRGSFIHGYRAEADRLTGAGKPAWRNPYVIYIGGAVLMLAVAVWLGGALGLAVYVALAGYAQSQLLLSDYVQHYGLQRATRKDGKPEPVAAKHSWNSRQWLTSAMMLHAPRHSDHHTHPAKHYPALTLPQDAPTLPRSLPAMATLALFPTLWFRVMNHRAARWRA